MSGEAYEGVDRKLLEADDIMGWPTETELQRIADDAAAEGYADFAAEVMDMVLEIRRSRNRLERRGKALWKRVNNFVYWKAGDRSKEVFEASLSE